VTTWASADRVSNHAARPDGSLAAAGEACPAGDRVTQPASMQVTVAVTTVAAAMAAAQAGRAGR
jgi:hypothetical protein